MASTYSTSLRLELMATGDQSGTWGDTTNTNLGTLLEQAITGVLSVAQGDTTLTLTSTDGVSDQARNAVVNLTGAMTSAQNVVVPDANKLYLVKNSTSGGFAVTVKTSAGTGVAVPAGTARWVYADGTNVVDGLSGPWTPSTNDGAALGLSATSWSDLFLASGGVINWDAGNYTLTHSAGLLTTNGNLSLTTSGVLTTGTIELGAAADTTLSRASAGILAVEGVNLLTAVTGVASTQSLASVNLALEASVASNALTIALKGADGNNPSATNPVTVYFRNVTAGTGTPSYVTFTAATSIVVSSGSTLGTTNAVANRVWVVAFNDGGTGRLGVINCLGATSIYPLQARGIASSTAEGGAGAADSAQVFYTGAAVTSKAYTVLGYVESTQATAGTWATSPSLVQLFSGGRLPGSPVSHGYSYSLLGSSNSATSYADVTNSSLSIAPTSAANVVRVDYSWTGRSTALAATNTQYISQVLRGATVISGADAFVGETATGTGNNQWSGGFAFTGYMDTPNTTASTTYKLQQKSNNASSAAVTAAISAHLTEVMT